MKSRFVFLIMLVLFSSVISAGYGCSDGSDILKDTDTIDLGEIQNPNGLKIALIDSSGGSRSVDILIDAKEVILTSEDNSTETSLQTGDFDISLINLTEELARIKIEGDEEDVEQEVFTAVDDLEVYITSMSGVYPGSGAEVNMMIGIKHLFLFYNDVSSKETINGKEYVIEFLYSTEEAASINVMKCANGSIIEIEEETPPVNLTNSTDINSTINNETNTSIVNETTSASNFSVEEVIENSTENKETLEPEIEGGLFSNSAFIIVNFVTFSLIIFFVIFYFLRGKKGNSSEKLEEQPVEEAKSIEN